MNGACEFGDLQIFCSAWQRMNRENNPLRWNRRRPPQLALHIRSEVEAPGKADRAIEMFDQETDGPTRSTELS
ncbi:hypothetical protein GCM10009857_16590 [Agromyces soli]